MAKSCLFSVLPALVWALVSPYVDAVAEIVAIVPDRSTAYPNGLHNGLGLSARRLNVTLEVRSVGNFDPETSAQVLRAAIDTPTDEQPEVYCIWPIDYPSRLLLKELYDTHGVPILQINQLPGADSQWEWDHLLGYAGPDDALRARNAGLMLRDALSQVAAVAALGYPESYGGYHLSIGAFAKSLEGSQVTLQERLPLDWGTQPAYDAVLDLLQRYQPAGRANAKNKLPLLHGIYAMDDSILMGAYQALLDMGLEPGVDIVLVGTVCNGARELLVSGAQYGTTVQGPFLEGKLAIGLAHEYLQTGTLSERIHFTPNPIATAETWDTMFVDFLGESTTVDELCTWSLHYERVAGPTSVDLTDDICTIVSCEYIPNGLFYVGYVLMGTNYGLAILAGILLFVYRNKTIIGIAQPFFLALVIAGSMVDTTSILFMSRDNRDYSDQQLDFSCVAWPVLLSIGHMMTTATLVCKIFRVKVLLDAGTNVRRVEVTVRQVSGFIIVFVGLDAVVLLLWYIMDPFSWRLESSSEDLSGYITQANGICSSEGEFSYLYPAAIAILHLGVLIYANVLAYQTSAYHKISDSKSVAIALFNSIQLLLIGAPILALVGDNVATSYLIRICFVFLNNFGVLVLIVLPKLYQCAVGLGDVLPEVDFSRISRKSRVTQLHGEERSKSGGSSSDNNRPSNAFDEEDEGSSRFKNSVRASFKTPLPFSGAMPPAESALQSYADSRKSVSFAEENLANKSGNRREKTKDDVFKFGKSRDVFSLTGWSEAQTESQAPIEEEDEEDDESTKDVVRASPTDSGKTQESDEDESSFEAVGDDDDDDEEEVVNAAVDRLTRSASSASGGSYHFM